MAGPPDKVIRIRRHGKYIGVEVVDEKSPTALFTFHLHRVEARKLANRLLKLVEGEADASFLIEGVAFELHPSLRS